MQPVLKLKFEDGVFVPLNPVQSVKEGDILEFQLPDPSIVYLCETDRLAAVESGHVVWMDSEDEGAASANAASDY